MDLKQWTQIEKGRAAALARRLGVPSSFVSKMANGEKRIPTEHMALIERFTDKQVTRQEMCPTRWRDIWPELAYFQGNPAAAPTQQAQAAIKPVAHGVAHG